MHDDFIRLEEILDAREKIRSSYISSFWKFSVKVAALSVAISIGFVLVSYVAHPEAPVRMYYFFCGVGLIGFGVLPISMFGVWMAKQFLWYHRELLFLERRIRAGELVTRPNKVINPNPPIGTAKI